jgi:hypothetical protein
MLPDTDALQEHAYEIESETRPLAVVGYVPLAKAIEALTNLRMGATYSPGAVPFVVEHSDGMVDCGYAAAQWAVDLYRWTLTSAVPAEHRDRIRGLLFGYAPSAIERFEVRRPVGLRADVGVRSGLLTTLARRNAPRTEETHSPSHRHEHMFVELH